MNVSWSPVIFVDISGSILILILAFWCAFLSREWTQKKPDDIFRHYIFLLTLAIVFFAISRSFGHLIKQILLLNDMGSIWKHISPFSGAINSTAFVVIFAFGIYFHRFQKVHLEIENYKNNLEEMIAKRTSELEETNIALADEITEREYTARALKESQGYLQAILDNTTLPMYLKDIEGRYILINKEYERLAHITNEEIVGKNDFDIFPEAIATLFRSQDDNVKKKNASIEFEETIPLDDGVHTFLTSKFPLRDDGIIYAVGGVCTDITKRKMAEEKLAAEQERLAVTLRSIGDGVITTDTAGKIVLINKITEQLTGWSQEEAAGKPLEDVFKIINEKTKEPCENPVTKVLKTGKIIALANHTALISKDGKIRSIADSGAPIRDKKSEIIGVVLVFRDVTEQNRMEEELLKVKKLESVGVLAGGIAHDFNNILAAILGNLNLARLDVRMEDQTKHLLAEAEKASLRAKDLTQQLLTFSKGGEPVKKTSSLPEVIHDSADFVLHGEKVSCEYSFPDDLSLVDIDKSQFSQVIQNIIINANHAMPDGGVIKVSCENIDSGVDPQLSGKNNYVKVSITDNGIGIPANVIEKIFDPYFSTKNKGSGLGLAICHSIIKKHSGRISVKSQPGKGTTFTIILPASTLLEEKEKKDGEINHITKAKIMVMDDEEVVRNVAQAMLSEFGHEVILAKDGDEAIQLFSESVNADEPIDLIIMDLTIPGGMGGKDAVKELLKINPNAKVIVSSGYSNDPIMASCEEYGFCAAVVKPYQLQDLKGVLGQVLG